MSLFEDNQNMTAEDHRALAREHRRKIKDLWRGFLCTGPITVSALVAVFFLTAAWYYYGNKVNASDISVSVGMNTDFYLATLADDHAQGVYDVTDGDDSALIRLMDQFLRNRGSDGEYTSFLDLPQLTVGTNTWVDPNDGKTYIVGDGDHVSLMVGDDNGMDNAEEGGSLYPGSSGEITFYLIPRIDNLGEVTMSISLQAYEITESHDRSDVGQATAIGATAENLVLLQMMAGHLLFFEGKDSSGNYKGRILPSLEADGSIKYTLSDHTPAEGWEIDTVYPITVYWVWPHRFVNLIMTGQDESLFTTETTEYTSIVSWIDNNREYVVNTNLFQNDELNELVPPSTTMSNGAISQWNFGYNRGDQLIGDRAAYFIMSIDATR